MGEFLGANKTKYDAGGSGDNVISDGYIKSVEKIWMDSYACGTTPISSADTICIATIPANKKITGVEIFIPASQTPTGATITVGTVGDSDKFISSTAITQFIDSAVNEDVGVIRMNNPDGFQFVTTAATDIFLAFDTIALTTTNGTIKTKVMYT